MEAFILAAGLGTRLKPITDSVPKALVKIKGRPLLEILIRRLLADGFTDIVVNVHHFGEQIISFLEENDNFGANIVISDERECLLDTGGGLKKAAPFLHSNAFLIHNVDILSGINLNEFMNFHLSGNYLATLAVQNRISSRYFLFDENRILCGWENVKSGKKIIVRQAEGEIKRFAFSGIHAINKECLGLLPDKEIFSIVEAYLSIAERHQITYFEHTDTLFLDLGKIDNLLEAEKIFSIK